MKQILSFSVFAVLLAFALPALLRLPERAAPETPGQAAQETPLPRAAEAREAPDALADAAITLAVLTDEGVQTLSMADYLAGALAGEMPASFPAEALKAQTVALRSYALYYRAQRKSAHPDADVCCSAACCAAWCAAPALRERWGADYDAYAAKLAAAVRETDGLYLAWEGAPALAVFHASSAGHTEDGAALGTDPGYLVSVDTPETEETVRNLLSTVEVSAPEFAAAVRSVAPDADLSGAPEGWVGAVRLDAAGRVASAELGGQAVSGLALRQLFSLRSTDFTLAYTDGRFLFRVRGYGHGLGMSQYGAALMASAGEDFRAILAHYYPGAALTAAAAGE